MIKLGYSTYPLGEIDVFEALPRIRELGYEAIEICVRDGRQTAATDFHTAARQKLVSALRGLGFPAPVLMDGIDVCAPADSVEPMLKRAAGTFQLAHDLDFDGAGSMVTTTAGHLPPDWESVRSAVRDAFLKVADLAAQYGVTVAVEAHAGSSLETPEKAVWLMENTRHEHLKLDLDISHFVVEGAEVQASIRLCAPHTVMIHVKDGYKEDGRVQYQLPGAGALDLAAFIGGIQRAGLDMPVFAEVSVQQFGQPDYEPWEVAEFCYRALDRGRTAAAAG